MRRGALRLDEERDLLLSVRVRFLMDLVAGILKYIY